MRSIAQIAFDRTEENLKNSLRKKYNANFKSYVNYLNNDLLTDVCIIDTAEEKLINFNIDVKEECEIKVCVNNVKKHVLNSKYNKHFALTLNGKSKISIAQKNSNGKQLTIALNISGEFVDLCLERSYFYSDMSNGYLITEKLNKFYVANSFDPTQALAIKNSGAQTVFYNYVCGCMGYNYTFYYITTIGSISFLNYGKNMVQLDFFVEPNSVIYYEKTNKQFVVYSLKNNKLIATSFGIDGVKINTITAKFNNIFIGKLFNVVNLSGDLNKHFLLVKDAKSQIFIVLCNMELMAQYSENYIKCIALYNNGESATGYMFSESQCCVIIQNQNSVNQINFLINGLGILKSLSKKIPDLFDRVFISQNYLINAYNGYLINETS